MILPSPIQTTKPCPWVRRRKNIREIRRDEAFAELKSSIQEYGILQSLICLEDGTLVSGERRFTAAIDLGLSEVPVTLLPADTSEADIIAVQYVENEHREDITDAERFGVCEALEELNISRTDIGKKLGKSASFVTKIMAVKDCPLAAMDAFLAGKLSAGDCYLIKTSSDPLATMSMRLNHVPREQVAALNKKRGDVATVKSQKIPVPLPGGTTVTIKAEAISLEEAVEALDEAKKAIVAAIKRGLNAKTAIRVFADVAAAG